MIVGDSLFAEIAHEYFEHDSEYDVVAFSVERDYVRRDRFRGLPVIPFDELAATHDPARHSVFVALAYGSLNRFRTRLLNEAAALGFDSCELRLQQRLRGRNVRFGEHCFVFEDNTLQPFVTIGRNCVLWSGNHIGHHGTIGDNVFVASHAVIAGSVRIGDNCFIGVNATLVNDIEIGADCWIGPAVTITRSVEPNTVWRAPPSERRSIAARVAFKVDR